MPEEDKTQVALEQTVQVMENVVDYIKKLFLVVIRGIVSTIGNPQTLTPDFILICSCKALAGVIGVSWAGDDDGVREFREKCRVAFSSELHKVPVTPLPKSQAQTEDSVEQKTADAA